MGSYSSQTSEGQFELQPVKIIDLMRVISVTDPNLIMCWIFENGFVMI
jgi:hypothetical protein